MDILALPTRYGVGKASVDAGGTIVTPTDASWYGNAWGDDLFFLPSQPLIPPQRIAAVDPDGTLILAYPWPGTAAVEQNYEIRFVGIIERSTAQSRRVLEQLGDVKAWYDIIVEDDAARLALESASNPLPAKYRVLVRLDGVIWMKKTSTFGDWTGPVEFKGDKGAKGWSAVFASVPDGERRVEQLVAWVGGEGAAPAGVGKYKGPTGLVDTAAEATDIRGPAGDISGVTPFWQGLITVNSNADEAREALGAGKVDGPETSTDAALAAFDGLSGDKLKSLTVSEARASVGLPETTNALRYVRRNAGNTAYEERTPAQVSQDLGVLEFIGLRKPTEPQTTLEWPDLSAFIHLELRGKIVLNMTAQPLMRVGAGAPDASAVYSFQAVDTYGTTVVGTNTSSVSGAPIHNGASSAGYVAGAQVDVLIDNFNIGWSTQFLTRAGYRSESIKVISHTSGEHAPNVACDVLRLVLTGGAAFTVGTRLMLWGIRG